MSEAEAIGNQTPRNVAEREELARQLGQRGAQAALEQLLGEPAQHLKCQRVKWEWGATRKAQRLANRQVRSLGGEVGDRRMEYACQECGLGGSPAEEAFGRSARESRPGVERWLG